MINIQKYEKIDQIISNTFKKVNLVYYLSPAKEDEDKQKKEFLAGNITEPNFTYKELKYNPYEIEEELNTLDIPDDIMGKIFRRKRDEMYIENQTIVNRGDKEIVRANTAELNGSPDKKLVDYAVKLFSKIPDINLPENVSAEKAKISLEQALTDYGLSDWKVEFSDKRLTTLYPEYKKITVCETRQFKEGAEKRLAVHEAGVHALRAANGYNQPLKIFAVGLPKYLSAEEGLAVYSEGLSNTQNPKTMRDYAGRVIAVDSVCKEFSFQHTFDRLRSFDLGEDQAWNLAVRAHRGGGLIKDHIYLDGYLKIKEFAENNGDFKKLYTGKIGLNDINLVTDLLEQKILKPAKYIPEFLK